MPLRRSLIFWFGLLGLIFILFVWADSTRHSTNFGLQRVIGLNSDGSLHLYYGFDSTYAPATFFEREGYRPGERYWFATYDWEYSRDHFVTCYLPHWLILLAYTAVWIALLLWRRCRLKRLLPPPAQPQTAFEN